MNEGARQALMDYLGGRYAERDGEVHLEPANERELAGVLKILRDRGGRLHHGLVLSRRRLGAIGEVDEKSALVRAEAGVSLAALEEFLAGRGLSLGPLSPGAMALDVAEFLEGPYAGLRAIPGGRLENVSIALSVMTADGRVLHSHESPRRAAGPDLDALCLGAGGRLGLVLAATLRCVVKPRTSRLVVYSLPGTSAILSALKGAIADGCWLERVRLSRRGERVLAEVVVIGTPDGVERDLSSVSHHVFSRGGRSSGQAVSGPESLEERELGFEALGAALERGGPLTLHRLSLASVIAEGEADGRPLSRESPWPLPSFVAPLCAAVDPKGVLGGTP